MSQVVVECQCVNPHSGECPHECPHGPNHLECYDCAPYSPKWLDEVYVDYLRP